MEHLFEDITFLQRGTKDRGKEDVPISSLKKDGKVLGLYFSAHWCPPCRVFTPKLVDWYNRLINGVARGGKLEIVFISSDREESDFDSHFDIMPWLALPYQYTNIKSKLVHKYKITGVPALILINVTDGTVITHDGRSLVDSDQNGDRFPWEPASFMKCLNGTLINSYSIEVMEWSSLRESGNIIIGLFFSAQWCQPCQIFTSQLTDFYFKMKSKSPSSLFEVIFVSSDNEEEAYKDYLSTMPWIAIPFNDERCKSLKQSFNVHSIPTLILFDAQSGHIITKNGRSMVTIDPEGEDFPWHPKPLDGLHEGVVHIINDFLSLVWFTDGSTEQMEEAKKILTPIADEYTQSQRHLPEDKRIRFFYANDSGLAASLREEVLKIRDNFPTLVLIDIPNQRKYICQHSHSLTGKNVKEFLTQYNNKALKSISL